MSPIEVGLPPSQSMITGLWLLYRLLTVCSRALRKGALRTRSNMTVDAATVDRITDRVTIGDWFFLMQARKQGRSNEEARNSIDVVQRGK